MISVLIVAPPREDLAELVGRHPSVEILRARDLEETLEKLGRNRRIDAVLLLSGKDSAEIAAGIREEDPGAPPLFAPASAGSLSGIRSLPAEEPGRLLDLLARELSS